MLQHEQEERRMSASMGPRPSPRAIVLTSHPRPGRAIPVHWGAADPAERGPVVATLGDPAARNAIGTHSGAYAVYRALAIAARQLAADHRPDLTDTSPAVS